MSILNRLSAAVRAALAEPVAEPTAGDVLKTTVAGLAAAAGVALAGRVLIDGLPKTVQAVREGFHKPAPRAKLARARVALEDAQWALHNAAKECIDKEDTDRAREKELNNILATVRKGELAWNFERAAAKTSTNSRGEKVETAVSWKGVVRD